MDQDYKTKRFLEKYKKLIDEEGMDFISIPVFIPDEKGGYRLVIQTQVMETKMLAKDFIPQK